MESILRIDLLELAGVPVLSGAPSGRQLYAKLVAVLPAEPETPEPLLLDFARVEVATAIYLRESVLEFRNFIRGRKSNFYPVVANAAPDIIDEISELMQNRGDVVMTCTTSEDGRVLQYQHLGKLDPMQKLTFDLVNSEGETTASKLMEIEKGGIKATAWNNRLAALSNLGLICEQSRGRAKTYRPVFHGDR